MPPASLLLQHIRHLATAPAVDGQSDRDLLQRFTRDRDGQAFAALLRRHGPMVWSACNRILPCASDAEDVLQATFLLLARKAAALRDYDSVGSWLYGVANRLALRTRSAAVLRSSREARTPPRSLADPFAEITLRETQQLLDEALARLPETCRAVLVLCYLEGLTQDEAARQLGCSRSTLKRRLHQGRARMRQHLLRRGLTLSAALSAAMLAPAARASLPAGLAATVLRAATGGPVAGRVANLAARGVGGVLAGKLRSAAAAIIAVIVTITGVAGTTAFWASASPADGPGDPIPPPAARPGEQPGPRVDRFGDPLPDEAVARIGTTRFRHGGGIHSISFAPDGKRLLSFGADGVRVWDAATGREHRHLASAPGTRFLWAGFSPDGRWVGTTEMADTGVLNAGPFTIWGLATGKKVKQLGNAVYYPVCFAPDGGLIAAARFDGVVEMWDVPTGKQLASWRAHESQPRAPVIAFTEDGKMLMTAGADQTVCFWEPATGKKLRSIDGIVNTQGSLALSRDGKRIAAVELKASPPNVIGGEVAQPRIRILDTANGKVLRQVDVPAGKRPFGQVTSVRHVAFSSDGRTLAAAGSADAVYLWDVATGKQLAPLTAVAPSALAFAPDSKTIAVGTWANMVQVHDVASGKELPRGAGLREPAHSVALTPDGKTLATLDGTASIPLWDPATGQLRRRLEGHETLVVSVVLSGDGRTLFSTGLDDTVRAWDVATGRELRRMAVEQRAAYHDLRVLAATPDGQRIIVHSRQRGPAQLQLMDVTTGETVRRIDPGSPLIHGATLLPDGRSLVVWTGDGKARVWDVTTGKTVRQLAYVEAAKSRPGPVAVPGSPELSLFAAAVSPDGRLIAFGSENDLIAIHDLASGTELRRVEKLPNGVGCVSFSPEGRMLAWGNRDDASIHLMEVATGKERHAFAGHKGGVVALTFGADGKTLLSSGNDTTLLVWDLAGRGGAAAGALAADALEALWRDLLGDDAPRAYRAVHRLAASPTSAVGLLRERIKPIAAPDEKRIARLVIELDSDDFSTRQKAAAELDALGDLAAGACRKALANRPSLEMRRRLETLLEKRTAEARHPSAERVRLLRALEILELTGGQESRQLLATLANGAPGAWLTDEAQAGLIRLARRTAM